MYPALKKSATVVAVAAVVALAANGVSYATTGNSLIGGHHNATTDTTTIADSGNGPALSLVSMGSAGPSLRVSSTARVPHLNSTMLQGRYASDLASHAITFTPGVHSNPHFTGDVEYALDIAPGVYNVSFDAVIGNSEGSPAQPTGAECGIFGIGNGFYPYAFASGLDVGQIPPQLSASNVVRVHPGGAILECDSNSPTSQFLFPVKASFVKMNTLSRVHAPVAPPKSRHLGFTK